jgi:energy-coupling factor transport system permease protein
LLQEIFNYSARGTVIHRLNPSLKILVIFALSTVAFCLVHPLSSLPLLVGVIIVVFIARVPWRTIRTFLAGILWMMVIAQLSFSLIVPPEGNRVLFSIGPKDIYLGNVLRGLSISFRLAIMTLLTTVLVATTSQRQMVMGMRGLHLPYSLSMVIGLIFRTMVTLATDWDTIKQAQEARCLDVNEGSILVQMRKRASVGMPLTAALINKMDHLSVALECRAVGGGRKPVEFFIARQSNLEKAVMVLATLATIAVVWLRLVEGYFAL